MTTGIDRHTGAHLADLDHLKQCIEVILTTRIGSRQMRYEFGSEFPALIDTPVHPDRLIEFYAATSSALDKWEGRYVLQHVAVSSYSGNPPTLVLDLSGLYLPSGQVVTIEGITIT